MAISSTNYSSLSYILETVPGTTPDTPPFTRLPITSIGLGDTISSEQSQVIRYDRMTDDLIIVDTEIMGDNGYELSYEPFKPLIISLMQDGTPLVIAISDTDIGASNTNSSFTSTTTDFTAQNIEVGNFVGVSGFTDPTNNGPFRVTAITANELTVTPAPGSDEAAGATIVMAGENVNTGYDIPDSYTFRKRIGSPSATTAIYYYRGCQINSMSFNFETGSILQGTMNIVGLSAEGTETPIAGEVVSDGPAYDIMNAVSSVTNIELGGLPATTEFMSVNLTFNNQIAQAKAIGTLGAVDLASFSWDISGEFEIYFVDTTLYNLYKNSQFFSVTLSLLDNSGNQIIFFMPKVKFETMSEPVEGKDAFLMESGTLRALRDATLNTMAQITFIPAP